MKYELKTKKSNNAGYTIIETMIAISLFVVVVTAGMGALLNANLLHQKSQDFHSIMDNLSFIMEDMGRNLRTGYDYSCINSGAASSTLGSSVAKSGQNCWGIAFEPSAGGNQWGYEIVSQTLSGVTTYFIERSTDNGATWVQLTPNEVVIDTANSNFSIVGAEPPPGDNQQPFVIIRLVGTITSQGTAIPFSLQTAVSQRLIDI